MPFLLTMKNCEVEAEADVELATSRSGFTCPAVPTSENFAHGDVDPTPIMPENVAPVKDDVAVVEVATKDAAVGDDVATSLPVESVLRSDDVRPVNQVFPEIVASDVELLEKLLRPVQVLLLERSVVDAPVKACCVFQKSAEVVENAAP